MRDIIIEGLLNRSQRPAPPSHKPSSELGKVCRRFDQCPCRPASKTVLDDLGQLGFLDESPRATEQVSTQG